LVFELRREPVHVHLVVLVVRPWSDRALDHLTHSIPTERDKVGGREDERGDDPRQERTMGTDEIRASIIGRACADGSASGS
jgi:hypothetical protein